MPYRHPYESTSQDTYAQKKVRVLALLTDKANHYLSNRKLAVMAEVNEKMIRMYRHRLLKADLIPDPDGPTEEGKKPPRKSR